MKTDNLELIILNSNLAAYAKLAGLTEQQLEALVLELTEQIQLGEFYDWGNY